MASRGIEYIWKVARPKNEAIAKALMYAAYQTAIQTDPNTSKVLIRSYVHPSTRTCGVYKKDNPHLTISVKTPKTELEGKHQSSHGYTPHINSFNVTKVVPNDYIKDDNVGNTWPAEMETRPHETITGEPALLGPNDDFITWPAEETGE
ncbi:hypothetical protein NUW58_g1725 [Xylaria curta]|uniref:Uncharacterized protein n=1 Tax=Xylaria curta TaxID=42375 RepID=A0ACC1PK29_9PEZI|nr:hypothetical protein NUW58_g1725 [Xylaria curta]